MQAQGAGRNAAVGLLAVAVLAGSIALAWLLRNRSSATQPESAAPQSDSVQAKRGRFLYQINCANCHGAEGRGDGPSAVELKVPPRDFAATWKYGTDAAAVRNEIVRGIPGTPMPGLGNALSAADLDALVAYLITFAPRAGPAQSISPELSQALTKAGFRASAALRAAPALALEDASGVRHSLDDYHGRVLVLHFWCTDCLPCLKEMPHLATTAKEFAGDGLTVLSICLDDDNSEEAFRLASQHAPDLAVHFPADPLVRQRYDVQLLPTTILIDRRGHLVGSKSGTVEWTSPALRDMLRSVLDQRD